MKPIRQKNGLMTVVIALLLTGAVSIASAVLPVHPLTNLVGVLSTPFRAAATALTGWGQGVYRYALQYDELGRRVAELEGQVARMEEENRAAEAALRENERLRTLLGLRERRQDFVFESAAVTGRTVSGWASTLTISKGSVHDVAVGDCVVTESGALVGVIRETGLNWSTVATILDPDLAVSVRFFATGDDGILQGDFALMGEGRTRVGFVSNQAVLEPGDTVLTSGMGGVYPSGLVAGRVEETGFAPSGTEQYAVVVPAADLERLEQVFVIKDFTQVE